MRGAVLSFGKGGLGGHQLEGHQIGLIYFPVENATLVAGTRVSLLCGECRWNPIINPMSNRSSQFPSSHRCVILVYRDVNK